MSDDDYDYLVASHGSALPPRDRIRLHDCQLSALDSLLRVMREEGIDREVRVAGVFSTASGITQIDIKFTDAVDPRGAEALSHEISFRIFETRFQQIYEEETLNV